MADVAIIGAGLMGRWHAATARRLGARIAAVVDPDLTAAERLARTLGGPRVMRSVEELLSEAAVSVGHVCTPVDTHYPISRELLRAGVHALVEKPLTATAAEAEDLVATSLGAGAKLCPVHQYAFQHGVEVARGAIARGGVLRRVDIDISSAGATGRQPGQLAAFCVEILPHPLSIIQRLKPDLSLAGLEWRLVQPMDGELLLATADSQTVISIAISTRVRPTRFLTRIGFESESMELDGFHGSIVRLPGGTSRASKIAGPFIRGGKTLTVASANLARRAAGAEFAYPGLRRLTELFYASVAGATPPPVSSHLIIDAAQCLQQMASLIRQRGGRHDG